jgi:non-ribosomal peptide synthetase component E (peptide arylation enzyme)
VVREAADRGRLAFHSSWPFRYNHPAMLRTQLYADPANVFVHDAFWRPAVSIRQKTALVDTSCGRRLTYSEYGETVEALARGLVAAGLKPGK